MTTGDSIEEIREEHRRAEEYDRRRRVERIITDNSSEKITVRWDGNRFALISERKNNDLGVPSSIIILNPREMLDLIEFAGKLGGEC